jgi:membrane-associated phospholipid phosphatase
LTNNLDDPQLRPEDRPRMTRSRTRWILLLIWIAILLVSLFLDRHAAEWVRQVHPLDRQSWIAWALKLPGYFPVTLAIAALLCVLHRRSWQAALPLVLSGPLVGLAYTLLKWIVGRHRPSRVVAGHPRTIIAPFELNHFAGGIGGLIHAESGLSFPSGHTALAFATATCLAQAFPRWRAVLFLLAAIVGAERMLENAHYLSDVVAGAGVGIACGWGAMLLSQRLIHPLRRDSTGGDVRQT